MEIEIVLMYSIFDKNFLASYVSETDIRIMGLCRHHNLNPTIITFHIIEIQ